MESGEQPAGRPGRRPVRPGVLMAVLVTALAVIVTLVVTGHGRHHDGGGSDAFPPRPAGRDAAGNAAPDTTARFSADASDMVVLDGVSGRIRITADADAHAVSVTYHRDDGVAAHVHGAVDEAAGLRTLTVVCGTGNGAAGTAGSQPCAGDLTVTVPARTGLRLRQTSGETVLEGLGGRLTVDVASDRLTAHALRSSAAAFTVTSGSADIGFGAAPGSLAVHATSASTAVRLPSAPDDGYAFATSATSADVQVKVPGREGGGHRVSLDVQSGSLAVLPA
jgi:hypothetical protein